ncbi:MAG: ParA family protein [Acidobacteriota bacterium]
MIISITNQKGGVGKTTTSINLAAALAQKNYKTLLADLDPQSNCSLSYLDLSQITLSMYDVFVNPNVKFRDITYKTHVKNLHLAPSRISLAKAESKLLGEFDSHFKLKDKIDEIKDNYDYIIIDTPPTLGLLTINALVASSHLIVPIQSSYFALEGTEDLLETYEKIRARPNPNLQFLGVVITLHDKRTILARDIKNQIRNVFGDKVFKTIISKSVRLEEAPAYKESIFTFAPNSSGALEYYKLSEEVIGRV